MTAGRHITFLLLLLAAFRPAIAVTVTDDSGRRVRLPAPAQRIVSLAPHITELLFAAGAGERIVATVRFSDYPAGARDIPRIGDTYDLDMERFTALAPDLVILWQSGTRQALVEAIRATGVPLYLSEPATLAAIAGDIEDLGRLAGTTAAAAPAAARFRQRLAALRRRYAGRPPVRVFYQFWQQPVFTVSGRHLISRVIDLCGGVNVFAGLPGLTPRVGVEPVLAADPGVIIASGDTDAPPPWLDQWRRWPHLTAVRRGQLYAIPPDLLLRPTPRILDGAEMMCRDIDRARERQ